MFLDDFVPIERSLLVANSWLISHRTELAEEAAHDTEIVLGVPRIRLAGVVIPLEWDPAGTSPFRRLEGDLATEDVGPDTTHLRLSATCQLAVARPGGRAQEQDAARRTQRDVRRFLARLAAAVERRSEPSLH